MSPTDNPPTPYRPQSPPPLSEQAAVVRYIREHPGCCAAEVARVLFPPGTPTHRSFHAVKYLLHADPAPIQSTYHPDDHRYRLTVTPTPY